jgi:hypothetical protein
MIVYDPMDRRSAHDALDQRVFLEFRKAELEWCEVATAARSPRFDKTTKRLSTAVRKVSHQSQFPRRDG